MLQEVPEVVIKEEAGRHVLFVRDAFGDYPAGNRLMRGFPWPEIAYNHATLAGAEKDAASLRKYLDEEWPKKVSASKLRTHGN